MVKEVWVGTREGEGEEGGRDGGGSSEMKSEGGREREWEGGRGRERNLDSALWRNCCLTVPEIQVWS